ncbi:MAG: flavodoxin family protein [Deltaproteobacteria bacterium]|nr:flavodoxin family protein [Deltaproteobacteria bacterium]
MHVMAINGSPRKERSSTSHILGPLLEGMRAGGATTEVVHLGQVQIKPCLGCFLCWVKTPGKCVQQDDMATVLERFVQADILIFGTPLYHYAMSGLLKNFIDRTLPIHEPWMVEDPHHPGRSTHPDRYPKDRAALLVSPCGFPEFNHFAPLVHYFQFYIQKLGWRYLGEILRPAGNSLSGEQYQEMFTWYYDLVRQAGEQLIRQGQISPEVQAGLRRDLFPGGVETFRDEANRHWAETMAKFGVTAKPPGQRG